MASSSHEPSDGILAATAIERLWRGEAGRRGEWLLRALAPLELAYRGVAGAYHASYTLGLRPAKRLPVPVVSVGNIAVGGTGKTPLTRWVVGELLQRGARPAVLHGGYAPDEPALHRRWHPGVPVVVDRDRVRGGRQAVEAGANVVVLDDAFQHRRLARDLDIVLVAAEDWARRPRLLPRGPWRESPKVLARAHVVVVTRRALAPAAAEAVVTAVRDIAPRAAAVRTHLAPAGWRPPAGGAARTAEAAGSGGPPPGGEVVAVAGIARPRAFVDDATRAGARIAQTLVFRDHHRYNARDAGRIRDLARGRAIVTTAKDAVKLMPLAPDLEVWVLEQEVTVESGAEGLARLLDGVVR